MQQNPFIQHMDQLSTRLHRVQVDTANVYAQADAVNYRDIPGISTMAPSQLQRHGDQYRQQYPPEAGGDYAEEDVVPEGLQLFQDPYDSYHKINLDYVRTGIMPARDLAEQFGPDWPKDANGAPLPLPDRSIATHSDVAHDDPETWVENILTQYDDNFVPEDPEHDDARADRRQQGLRYDDEELRQQAQTTPFDHLPFETNFTVEDLVEQAEMLTGLTMQTNEVDQHERYWPYIGDTDTSWKANERGPDELTVYGPFEGGRVAHEDMEEAYGNDELKYMSDHPAGESRVFGHLSNLATGLDVFENPGSSHGSQSS